MIQLPEDRTPPMTTQLALRVTIVGTCALVMFGAIFFRLWFLQVLSGNQYLAQAQTNFVRDIAINAPRGEILDRNGALLVDSEPAPSIEISAPDLPVPVTMANLDHQPARDLRLYRTLETVLGKPHRPVRCHVNGKPPPLGIGGDYRMDPFACAIAQGLANLPYANITVAQDVSRDVQDYLLERQTQFPGVVVQTQYLRHYPQGTLAAQLFGTVGPINPAEIKLRRYKGVSQQAIIGQSGLEYEYDQYLRGVPGAEKVLVNSQGQFEGYSKPTPPVPGQNLKLSVDLRLQKAGERALAQSIAANYPANAGAFVALDPTDGEVLAMGSSPTFDPNVFTHPISQAKYNRLFGPASGAPQFNRAISGAGPTGSTFKLITANAALQSGVWSPGETFDDTGQFCVSGQCRHNAGHAVYGVIDIVNAIKVSSDDFFYHLGALLNADPVRHPNGGELQTWARKFGIGQKSGIDLPDEVSGIVPTPAWRAGRNQLEAECDTATGMFRYTDGRGGFSAHPHKGFHHSPTHPPGGCGIADGTNRPWSIGDNINLAIGQGDVQVTPIQLAVAYSAFENDGWVIRPHVGLDVESQNGTVLQRINPPPKRHIRFNETDRQTILAGLHAAAMQPGGTSSDVMGNFPLPVYAKTGTAQYTGKQDYAWYACFVPSWVTKRPIVIVVTVEQGGFGDVAAAPVARQMLNQWFFGRSGAYKAGSSQTL